MVGVPIASIGRPRRPAMGLLVGKSVIAKIPIKWRSPIGLPAQQAQSQPNPLMIGE